MIRRLKNKIRGIAGDRDPLPASWNVFFIRGSMRSGTNWVANLLNSHPGITCTGEFYFDLIRLELNRLMGISYSLLSNEAVGKTATGRFEQMVKDCIYLAAKTRDKPNALWYGDRTPRPLEPIVVKGAPSFLIRRDGRDVLVSWVYHLLRVKVADHPFGGFSKMQEKVARFEKDKQFFKAHPELLLDDEEWVKHFARDWKVRMDLDVASLEKIKSRKLKASVHVISYEKLHKNVLQERNRMYQFLGLDPAEARPLDDLTKAGFSREDFLHHNRKGAVGEWKKYFTKKTCKWFIEEAGETLITLGYESGSDWTNTL